MRELTQDVIDALSARQVKARDFIWITGKDENNDPVSAGFWNDSGTVTVSYIDVDTGNTESRDYTGAGTLLSIDDIPLVNDVSVRNITVALSQIDETVADLVRGYNLRNAPVEIHRGFFNPGTYQLVDALTPRFVGYVDTMEILDPAEGQEGRITLNLVSHTRELTRANTDVCSDPSQKLRSATDNFYADTAVVGNWQIFWGQKHGKVDQHPERQKVNRYR